MLDGTLGGWSNTIGVYDDQLVAIAQSMGESVESAAAQANYQGVYSQVAEAGAGKTIESPCRSCRWLAGWHSVSYFYNLQNLTDGTTGFE